MAGIFIGDRKRVQASFTVEAALVLFVVFLTAAFLIKRVYVLHDQVTGTMILEETVEKMRYRLKEEAEARELIEEGELLGNPRLWLGDYEIQAEEEGNTVRGKASAGEWSKEIEMKKFQPEQFLRRYQALKEIGEWVEDNGS